MDKIKCLRKKDHTFIRDSRTKPKIDRCVRAAVIEKLFESIPSQNGKKITFAAVALFDRYMELTDLQTFDKDEVNLTAFVCLYLATEEKKLKDELAVGLS